VVYLFGRNLPVAQRTERPCRKGEVAGSTPAWLRVRVDADKFQHPPGRIYLRSNTIGPGPVRVQMEAFCVQDVASVMVNVRNELQVEVASSFVCGDCVHEGSRR
jgi:hypothetical protein